MDRVSASSWRSRLRDLQAGLFHCFPHHWLSAVVYALSRAEAAVLKNFLIRGFVALYDPDMQEAEVEDPKAYPTLNALFVRTLKPGNRPWPTDPNVLAVPCDSQVSQFGRLSEGRALQAKGLTFTTEELLGGAHPEFSGGLFATLYLSPKYCHRVYMPADGRLLEMRHIPGRQFTVSPYAVERIPRLYARNERVVSLFEDSRGIPFAVVMVGAVSVASIEMSWCGVVAPRRRAISRWRYGGDDAPGPELRRGDELGCFHLGSTVVIMSGHRDRKWAPAIKPGEMLLYGQSLLRPESAEAEAGDAAPGGTG